MQRRRPSGKARKGYVASPRSFKERAKKALEWIGILPDVFPKKCARSSTRSAPGGVSDGKRANPLIVN